MHYLHIDFIRNYACPREVGIKMRYHSFLADFEESDGEESDDDSKIPAREMIGAFILAKQCL